MSATEAPAGEGAVAFSVNGRPCAVTAPAATPLLHVLRETLGLPGTRFGCGEGACGACRVLVDGRALSSCDLPLWAVQGREVTTVEGLDPALAEAFEAEQAAQCGYCSSGMLVAAAALLRATPRPAAAQVIAALDDQLCRCGAQPRIVRAVLRSAERMSERSAARAAERSVPPPPPQAAPPADAGGSR